LGDTDSETNPVCTEFPHDYDKSKQSFNPNENGESDVKRQNKQEYEQRSPKPRPQQVLVHCFEAIVKSPTVG
jgi:hypothetical protein